VIADGPRADKPGEAEKCAQVKAIIDRVDWDCEVLKNYSDENLGCKMRPASGLDWVFDTVEEAIILEDDCLPHPTFFRYCQELLDYYRNDNRIMMISGNNFQFGRKRTDYSYYFSKFPHIWGWASWRRAWKYYDIQMTLWPEVRKGKWLQDILKSDKAVTYWTKIFDVAYKNQIDAWDYQWTFACWIQNGLSILPNINLVSNIGFRPDATHTKGESILSNVSVEEMVFPLKHCPYVICDEEADNFTMENIFIPKLSDRIKRKLKAYLL